MRPLAVTGLLLCMCAALATAALPQEKVQEAIDYLQKVVPDADSYSSDSWSSRLQRAVSALRSHPEYSRWLAEDEAAAVASAAVANDDAQPAFGCNLKKSSSPPRSVHKLQPGDVKVVGAVGDSLTAANGALATNVLGLLVQYRGYAWSIGGQVPLKSHTTLANILREGNSALYGHSTSSGSSSSSSARMNVAEPGKKALDMPGQAVRLVKKLKSDKNIDFQNDWKVITLFIGGNDVCDYCKDKSKFSAANYVKHIKAALDHLHANVPKAFVNVAEVLDVSLVKELKKGTRTCGTLLGGLLCKCAASPSNAAAEKDIENIIAAYQKGLRDLVNSGRYDTREDFTVVNQPFYRNSQPPRINGKFDLSFFAPDCFHFSRKGHQTAATALWNNMLERVGKKSTDWNAHSGFLCPTSSRPYFATSKNS